MRLTSEKRLGPYEIVGPLGEGGMGEDYRVRDTRLGRDGKPKPLTATAANERDGRRVLVASSLAEASLSNLVLVTDSTIALQK
jgi:eukaryotic-like serine/threonine-protein kinase